MEPVDDADSSSRPEGNRPPSSYAEALGRAIQVLRTERGIGRAQLAKLADVSYSYLSEIETGKKQGSSRALFAIAQALGVSPKEIYRLAEDRVLPTMFAPPPESSAPPTQESRTAFSLPLEDAPGSARRSWFRRASEESSGRSEGERNDAPALDTDTVREQIEAIVEELTPADRALLLEFARRLLR